VQVGGGGGTCGRVHWIRTQGVGTDVSLSGEMSGIELAQYAKRKFPHINVIMVSGRSPPYIPQDASFLLKPYRPRELLEAVLL
jgi:CheY-like chemotaxis protein